MGRQNQRFLIESRRDCATTGEPIIADVLFDIKQTVFDTLQAFKKAATRNYKLSASRVEQIIAGLPIYTISYLKKRYLIIFALYSIRLTIMSTQISGYRLRTKPKPSKHRKVKITNRLSKSIQ